MSEMKECPCCGNQLMYMIPRIGTPAWYVCTSAGCLFRCNAGDYEHYEQLCAAMKTYDSAKKLAEWVIANPRHTYDCLTHDMLGTGCICGYDDAAKLAKELLGGR